jgi:hypothetical protein
MHFISAMVASFAATCLAISVKEYGDQFSRMATDDVAAELKEVNQAAKIPDRVKRFDELNKKGRLEKNERDEHTDLKSKLLNYCRNRRIACGSKDPEIVTALKTYINNNRDMFSS